jgi:tetratricopeptide (TPR) repeat protein
MTENEFWKAVNDAELGDVEAMKKVASHFYGISHQHAEAGRVEKANDCISMADEWMDRAKKTEVKPKVPVPVEATAESLTKRGFIFLEDLDLDRAQECFDNALNIDPEYARAYIGLLCAELVIESEAELENGSDVIADEPNFMKALRFADEDYRATLESINRKIVERNAEEERQKQGFYATRSQLLKETSGSTPSCIVCGISYHIGYDHRDPSNLRKVRGYCSISCENA